MKNLFPVGRKRAVSYAGLVLVVIIWGLNPIATKYLQNFYSPAILTTCTAAVSAVALLIVCRNKLCLLNREYFKVAGITGIFYALGEIVQKIGLPYTTPSVYAFLENLAVVVVPVLSFIFIKKRPSAIKILASLICLFGVFVLTGGLSNKGEFKFGLGEMLCALSGIFYGVNIAGTGAFAKDLDSALYIMIQMIVHTVLGVITTVTLNFMVKPNGEIFEPVTFSFSALIFIIVALALLTSVFCWLVRTEAMKYIDASVVAIIMPFSAVITGVASVIAGTDELTSGLVMGGTLCLIAAIASGLSDAFSFRKHRPRANTQPPKTSDENNRQAERTDILKDETISVNAYE